MGKLNAEFSTVDAIGYAAVYNGVQLINELYIENTTDNDILSVDISVFSPQGLIENCKYHLEVLPKNLKIDVNTLKIIINEKYLASIESITAGELILKITSEGRELLNQTNTITILPYEYWMGADIYPEITAAFVSVKGDFIQHIVSDASGYLKKWCKSTHFLAYNGDANRIQLEAAALYAAIKDARIEISPIISGNRTKGQPILLSNILSERKASVQEIAFLYASVLEAVGLNPILAIFEQNILVGVWLEDRTFPDCINDDVTELSKKSAVGEMIVADVQFLDTHIQGGFDEAKNLAMTTLTYESGLIYFIDIKRCRYSNIYPNPERKKTESGWEITADSISTSNRKPQRLEIAAASESDAVMSKQKYWERKLLDLSLKNSLLNFRLTKNVLPVMADSLTHIAEAFCNGNEFDILPIMKEAEEAIQNYEISQGVKIANGYSKLIAKEIAQNKLRAALSENLLKSTVTNVYRKYKSSIEENGVCTLYFALGLLKWYENEQSMKPLYAPLILIPLDLIRKNARRYILKARDDEPYFNITLLEMLKQQYSTDIGGLDPLPKNPQNVIDVGSIMNTVRKAVMNQSRWDITEECYISNFSFSGIVMWHDIRNKLSSFKKTPVVKGLISGIPFNKTSLEVSDIDERWLKEDIILPIEADSSQLEAIYYANRNTSFVLHGPPGTGKSQTITNIIANCLLKGQRVLFVAEKMAALSVVKKRLDEIGIGDFCLELHSDKTSKKDVLEALQRTGTITKVYEPKEYGTIKEKLEKTRKELGEYMTKLHREQKFGFSLSQAISEYLSYNFVNQFVFPAELIPKIDNKIIETAEGKLYELLALGKELGHPFGCSLEHIGQKEFSQSLKIQCEELIKKYLALISKLRTYTDNISRITDISKIDTYQKFYDLFEVFSYLCNGAKLINLNGISSAVLDKLKLVAKIGEERNIITGRLSQKYNIKTFKAVPDGLVEGYLNASGLKKTFKKHKIIKILKKSARSNANVKAGFLNDINDIQEYLAKSDKILQFSELTEKYLPDIVHDFAQTGKDLSDYINFRDRLERTCADSEEKDKICSYRFDLKFSQIWTDYVETQKTLQELLIINFENIGKTGEWWLEALTNCAVQWSMDELKERCAYNQVKSEINDMGLDFVTRAYDLGLAHEMLFPAYKKAMLKAVIENIITGDEEFNKFTGRLFEEKIRRFKELEQKYRLLSRQQISAKLAMNLPNFDIKSSQMSELGIFQRTVTGGGKSITLKKFFEQIPNILPKVAPCVLMSPVTVAQYINPEEPFDILIFDEASQLTTAKAVGALSRAKTAIIVGDPKQLPPTTFFENINVNEEDMMSEDLESVLDDCLALNMPEIHLKWHYRSRDESLIAYSNRSFYDNSLYTFPSPSDTSSCIKFVKINGVYDRGRTKQNTEEALAVTEEVIKRLSHPESRKKSIGIVTFSVVQQNLIDDMLTETFRQSPKLEQYAMQRNEPLFVKNLENVQGDERDIILFSVGYGLDQRGKLSLNFGPINRDGGWRRLNVAFSRAKYEMVVFSSITYDMINSSTASEGVKALRGFLEYAQRGRGALVRRASEIEKTVEGIEEEILKGLKKHGYNGVINYGTSGYKVNVAVTDPDNPSKYILGIMCDGEGYSKVKTVNDREVSPFGVLKKLGWNLYRVWALDFWDNPSKILTKIISKIESLRHAEGVLSDDIDAADEVVLPAPREIKITNALEAEYVEAAIPTKIVPSVYFSTEYHQPHLINITKKIINTQSPVSYHTLMKSVLASCGITRAGSRINEQMEKILEHIASDVTIEGGMRFFWKKGTVKENYNIYRIGGNRSMDDISIYEIINAIRYIAESQISIPEEALSDEIIKLLQSNNTEDGLRQINRAIKYGIEKKIITSVDKKITAGENLKNFEV